MLAVYEGVEIGDLAMTPPTDDDDFVRSWRDNLFRDMGKIRPDIERLSEKLSGLIENTRQSNDAIAALHRRLDGHNKTINQWRGAIIALGAVGSLAWAYIFWMIQQNTTAREDTMKFIARQETFNTEATAKINAALAVPTDISEMQQQMQDLTQSMRNLENAVHAKTPKVTVQPPTIIIQKPDQSRTSTAPPYKANPPSSGTGLIPRMFGK